MQGMDRYARNCVLLEEGSIIMPDTDTKDKINVIYDIDANGMINVTAYFVNDESYRASLQIQYEPT